MRFAARSARPSGNRVLCRERASGRRNFPRRVFPKAFSRQAMMHIAQFWLDFKRSLPGEALARAMGVSGHDAELLRSRRKGHRLCADGRLGNRGEENRRGSLWHVPRFHPLRPPRPCVRVPCGSPACFSPPRRSFAFAVCAQDGDKAERLWRKGLVGRFSSAFQARGLTFRFCDPPHLI